MGPKDVKAFADNLKSELGKIIIGQDDTLELFFISLLSGGHILLEGVPGTGKTLIARTFAKTLALQFGRIQFTPDLMPGDVLGTNLFNFQTNSFQLTKGPIFTELLLADEINRTPPKTQAALLQAMQERAVTIDGETYDLGTGFMVIATQNPIEQQGTYPLPEAQLDRFLFKHILTYPNIDDERLIVKQHGQHSSAPEIDNRQLSAIAGIDELTAIRDFIQNIRVSDDIIDYVVNIIRATRENPSLEFGASPRAAAMIAAAARTMAALNDRDFVIPDDVKYLTLPALRHRVVLSASAEIEGLNPDQIISKIINSVEAPR